MKKESAVQFETESRIHMGLVVKNLERSIAFYRTLFGQGPTKTRPGYAKFEVAEPPVNLSLNEVGGDTGPNNPVAHFGIQVKSTEAVKLVAERLAEAGLKTSTEENVTCCYAVQNKVWATDPDGNKWEVYVVLENDGAHHHSSQGACCPDMPAIIQAVERGDLAGAQAAFQKAGGIPIFTAELKIPLTGQTVENAVSQYRNDRDPREPLFVFGRCLAHFAVDPDLVYMTTHLQKEKTRFLPYNMGRNGGAGNPPSALGFATAYLWEQTWSKDSVLDLIQNFIQVVEEEDDKGKKTGKLSMVFPRYHQIDCVRRLVADCKKNGPGQRYLIQHSAGSAVSNLNRNRRVGNSRRKLRPGCGSQGRRGDGG